MNLNRSYAFPSLQAEPAVYAIRNYVDYLKNSEKGVELFTDIHAQSSKRSCWLFGNALELDQQVDNQLFAKLMGLNSAYFDFNDCDFSERSMQHKDPKDHHSKEGSARVAVYKRTGLIHSYTLECPYYCPQPLFRLDPVTSRRKSRPTEDPGVHGVPSYNKAMFKELAEGFAAALLDLHGLNPFSRLGAPTAKSLREVKEMLRNKLVLGTRAKKGRQLAMLRNKPESLRTRTPLRKLV